MFLDAEIAQSVPALEQFDWSQCRHESLRFVHIQSNGKPQYQCRKCKKTFTKGARPKQLDQAKAIATALLANEGTQKELAYRFGVAPEFVGTVAQVVSSRRPRCKCGGRGGHRGACATKERRQDEIMRLVAEGYSNEEVAARTGMARKTVKVYVSRGLDALGVSSRFVLIRQRALAGACVEGASDTVRMGAFE